MDKRIEQLWDKAEAAIDADNIDAAEEYRALSHAIVYQRRLEAKDMRKTFQTEQPARVNRPHE